MVCISGAEQEDGATDGHRFTQIKTKLLSVCICVYLWAVVPKRFHGAPVYYTLAIIHSSGEVKMKKATVCMLALAFAGLVPAAPKDVTIPFKVFKLQNGLTVILSEDHTAPTYS